MNRTSIYTLIMSLFLFALSNQTLGSWGLGPLCAVLGAYRLQRRPGDSVGQVMRMAMGWGLPLTLLVFVLRVVAAVSGIIVYLNAPQRGWQYDVNHFFQSAGIFAWGAFGGVALWVFAAPWVRAWHNTSLGIWAAGRAKSRSERVWMALVVQLGLGLATAWLWLCIQSSIALAVLVYFEGSVNRRVGRIYPSTSLVEGQAAITTALIITLGIGIYLVGQALLPALYLHLAKRRLSGQLPSEDSLS